MTENVEQIQSELAKDLLPSYDNNPALTRLVIQSIVQSINQSQPNQFLTLAAREQSARTDYLYNLQKKFVGLKTVEEQEDEDYEQDQKSKKEKDSNDEFKTLTKTIDKYKLLGYNSKGWPIFRVTDVYYASDPYIEKIYEDKINQLLRSERPKKAKDLKGDGLMNILEKWKNRETNEFYEQDKDEITQEELKDMVADMGEKRENFFLYYKDYEPAREKYFEPKEMSFSPFNSCDFLENFKKAVLRRRQQYVKVAEFESDQEGEKGVITEFDAKPESKSKKLWGQFEVEKKEPVDLKSKIFTVNDQLNQSNTTTQNLTSMIIKQHSFINSQVVEEKYKLPLESLQRIEIDLSNPDFFLTKLNLGLSRRGPEIYQKMSELNKLKSNIATDEQKNVRTDQQSVISQSSRHTGGPTVSLKPISDSILEQPVGMDSFDKLIAQRLKVQTQKKTNLYHSDVATQLMFSKFKLEPKDFANYHRYNYPWRKHDNIELSVLAVKSKPLKSKGEFLELNTEKQESHVKFSSFSSLSLVSGDFIIVQNIEECPLILSNVGMCSKMYLQVNPKAIINQMNTDLYGSRQFQQLEQARQRMNISKQNMAQNCNNWRRVITDNFGPNGKLHIGSENSSLLIGTPDGPGVAVMDSDMSSIPIVKQKNNPNDFILVREGGSWYIRRIETFYTSGQIEPKMEVFQPDSRNIVNFNVSYFKAYAKKRFELSSSVHIEEFKETFSIFNQHNIRKNLKEIGARTKDNKHFMGSEEKDMLFEVTPEQICLYEKMQNSLHRLQSLGICTLKTADKLKQTITVFFKKYPNDLTKFAYSKFISDELQLTSWYLSESFLNAEQGQSKIELVGIGDPTNGHGGYSFIKKPQKERIEKEEVIDKKVDKKVSGTKFDLRKLQTVQIEKLLLERGKKKEDFEGMSRWPKINMLKKIGGDQYERPERHNKNKKKESEKKEINTIFNRLLKNLSVEDVDVGQIDLNAPQTVGIEYYIKRETQNWEIRRNKLFNQGKGGKESGKGEINEEEDQEEEDEGDEEEEGDEDYGEEGEEVNDE